ncbi:hypothetical protein [Intestinirhabdus alba]|jgi:hypothetical protein|uniref:Uncharacterized protein n=1 Tax=Intestinirhabdus alba TaxID=2899544 RepID=A0A6L6IU52_9ENTR|nr:hypothetical protein [Intestinirhabdus alba]MTH48263.1 hypothetical protein [Intestinirhabdus alba]
MTKGKTNDKPNKKSSAGVTKKSQEPNVKTVKITRAKRLDIMLVYGGEDGYKEMQKAADFKSKRLQEKHKTHEIKTYVYTNIKSFKQIWTEIYKLTQMKTSSGSALYSLHEMHLFGHSSNKMLYLVGKGENITISMVIELEKLDWHKKEGCIIFHSCRSGRYEDNTDKKNTNCIAREFSKCQKVITVGQMVYATFNTGDELKDWRKRNKQLSNKLKVDLLGFDSLVLWGYKSERKVKKYYSKDPEYSLLEDWQIWPARMFISGEINLARICYKGVYNNTDEKYI